MNAPSALASAYVAFRDDLIDDGLLVPMGSDGLFGRGAVFESIVTALDTAQTLAYRATDSGLGRRRRKEPLVSRCVSENVTEKGGATVTDDAIHLYLMHGVDHRCRCTRPRQRLAEERYFTHEAPRPPSEIGIRAPRPARVEAPRSLPTEIGRAYRHRRRGSRATSAEAVV